MWIESLQAPSLRLLVPWVLIGAGLVSQVAGVRLLADKTRAATTSPPAFGEFPASPVEEPDGLSSLDTPIAGARVPTNPELLPGSGRAYRGGKHEGVDFSCHPDTPVMAAADGWVMSIDDEPNLPESRRNELLGYCKLLRQTPPEVLSVLHGRRVTLCHGMREGRLLTTSYSHLGCIGAGIRPGVHLRRGDLIGETGSSGTSHAYGDGKWSELHFEVRLNGVPLGSGLAPTAAGQLYREFLDARATR